MNFCGIFGGANQSRTGLNGFAGRGITALLSRLCVRTILNDNSTLKAETKTAKAY
jgi:hypothetical protein